jgi:hypothetical protein
MIDPWWRWRYQLKMREYGHSTSDIWKKRENTASACSGHLMLRGVIGPILDYHHE